MPCHRYPLAINCHSNLYNLKLFNHKAWAFILVNIKNNAPLEAVYNRYCCISIALSLRSSRIMLLGRFAGSLSWDNHVCSALKFLASALGIPGRLLIVWHSLLLVVQLQPCHWSPSTPNTLLPI